MSAPSQPGEAHSPAWRFELFVALRYLRARRKQTLVSVVTFIAIAGVMVGVSALIIALALMTGFSTDIQSKILGTQAHVYVRGDRYQGGIDAWREAARDAAAIPHVVAVAPTVEDAGILEGPVDREPITLIGIEPVSEGRVSSIGDKMRRGSLALLVPVAAGGRGAIVLGRDLADAVGAGVGDPVRYVSLGRSTLSPMGPVPIQRTFVVTGVFETGLYEYDRGWALVHLAVAQDFTRMGDAVSLIRLKADSLDAVPAVSAAARARFGTEYVVQDIMALNRPLFSAFKLEKTLMFITIGLIVVVAAFNIVTTLTMMVMEKNKDIAILMTMGLGRAAVMRIFMFQGLLIGAAGTTLGFTFGVSVCWVLDTFQLISLPTTVYYIPYLPFKMKLVDVAAVSLLAVLVSFLATLYPALRAGRLDAVEALRNE